MSKTRITDELIRRAEQVFGDGTGELSRSELRLLHRKGYLERGRIRADDGSMRYRYKMKSIFKEA